MINLCETIRASDDHRPVEGPLLDAWFELNYRLQEEAIDTQINKAFVEEWLIRLWTIVTPAPQCFWLFLARINELALLCASRYVDCCEFAAADELLVKPSSALLRVEWRRAPFSLGRAGRAGRRGEGTSAGKKGGPLLPCLYGLLKRSGYMTEGYLLSVSRRTEKIAQVAGMLTAFGRGTMEDISMKLSSMDVDQRKDFRLRLCLFDRKIFNEIGRALHLFMHTGNVDDQYAGKYLHG
jgi:hypothetical protein